MKIQYLWGISILVSLMLYSIFRKRDRNEAVLVLVMGLTVPGIGICFGILSLLLSLIKTDHNIMMYQEKLEAGKKYHQTIRDIVPINEALVLDDRQVKKKVLIEALKMDKTKYIGSLCQAAENEDSEASHYGAVALMDIKDYFNSEIKSLQKKFNENPDDFELASTYCGLLQQSIESGLNEKTRLRLLLDQQRKLIHIMIKRGWAQPEHYEYLIAQLIKEGDAPEVHALCEAFMAAYPDDERPYFAYLNYYYQKGEGKLFNGCLDQLKRSKVILSQEGLQKMRFWLEETNE